MVKIDVMENMTKGISLSWRKKRPRIWMPTSTILVDQNYECNISFEKSYGCITLRNTHHPSPR